MTSPGNNISDAEKSTLYDSNSQLYMSWAGEFGKRRRPLEGTIASGSLTLDAACGAGGLPRGRMVELFGPPGVGKTTLGLQAIAACQRDGGMAVYVDVERSFDAAYANRIGVQVDRLLIATSEDGDQALRVVCELAASQAVDLIVVDSVAALLPPEEAEAAFSDSNPFAQCEMLASGLRRLARVLYSSPACVLFLNQMRSYQGFGYDETSPGGWSLKLHAAVRASVRPRASLPVGRRLQLKVVKSHFGGAAQMEFDFLDGVGVHPEADLIDRGMDTGVVRRDPTGYWFAQQLLGRERGAVLLRFSADAALQAEVRSCVSAALGGARPKPVGRAGRAASGRVLAMG